MKKKRNKKYWKHQYEVQKAANAKIIEHAVSALKEVNEVLQARLEPQVRKTIDPYEISYFQ